MTGTAAAVVVSLTTASSIFVVPPPAHEGERSRPVQSVPKVASLAQVRLARSSGIYQRVAIMGRSVAMHPDDEPTATSRRDGGVEVASRTRNLLSPRASRWGAFADGIARTIGVFGPPWQRPQARGPEEALERAFQRVDRTFTEHDPRA